MCPQQHPADDQTPQRLGRSGGRAQVQTPWLGKRRPALERPNHARSGTMGTCWGRRRWRTQTSVPWRCRARRKGSCDAQEQGIWARAHRAHGDGRRAGTRQGGAGGRAPRVESREDDCGAGSWAQTKLGEQGRRTAREGKQGRGQASQGARRWPGRGSCGSTRRELGRKMAKKSQLWLKDRDERAVAAEG